MQDHLLVFVPGIMGTELYFEGIGPAGIEVREDVWTRSLYRLWHTLAASPDRLQRSTPLKVGSVLRSVRLLKHLPTENVYGPLIDFICDDLKYIQGRDFIAWGYDWRQSNDLTAASLAKDIRRWQSAGATKFKFVCHSMGGLVVRLMLAQTANADIRSMCQTVVQIGTPVRGSTKAYYCLKESPKFNFLVDLLIGCRHRLAPSSHTHLMSAIESFESLFELLPHHSQHVLHNSADDSFSALDGKAWPKLGESELDRVKRLQTQLSTLGLDLFSTIFSDDVETDASYQVDGSFRVLGTSRTSNGDGTVSIASAVLDTTDARRCAIHGGVSHDRLPKTPDVWKAMKELLK